MTNKDLKNVVSCWGFKKSIFFRYFESLIHWEYTVKILDQNIKYLRNYSADSRARRDRTMWAARQLRLTSFYLSIVVTLPLYFRIGS